MRRWSPAACAKPLGGKSQRLKIQWFESRSSVEQAAGRGADFAQVVGLGWWRGRRAWQLESGQRGWRAHSGSGWKIQRNPRRGGTGKGNDRPGWAESQWGQARRLRLAPHANGGRRRYQSDVDWAGAGARDRG